MFAAVVGTTFTTVVVFAPLALLSGVTGSFLGAFAITLAIAVLLSMVMALTLIPMLAALAALSQAAHVAERRPIASAARSAGSCAGASSRRVVIVALLGVGRRRVARSSRTGFLPRDGRGRVRRSTSSCPPGTSLEETERVDARRSTTCSRDMPEVVAFTRRTGTELGPATATMQSRGDIMVRLVAARGSRRHRAT